MSIKTNPKKCMIIVLAFLISTGSNAHADFTFGEPTNLGPTVNSPHSDFIGSFSSDALEMYFDSDLRGPFKEDIYVSTRATTDDAWGTPVKLGPPVNSSSLEVRPIISADGLSLYFASVQAGGYGVDICVTTRETIDDDWGGPSNLGPTINTPQDELAASMSFDGLLLYFYSRNRPGGYGGYDIWVSTRQTKDADWGEPMNLGPPVNSSSNDACPYISADGLMLLFNSNRPGGVGGEDIWQAPILPIVDLNGDGIVDSADMCIIVDNWGTDNSLCDIGPMPWGDGIVDVQDLIVLAEHLFEELPGRPIEP